MNRLKWHLLKRWFAPEKTINKKLYSSLTPDNDDADDLGLWERCKRYLLLRWLPEILSSERRATDPVALAELGSRRTSLHSRLSGEIAEDALSELAKYSAPVAIANAEPEAAQPVAIYGLRPLNLAERRRASGGSSPRASTDEQRPSSRGSSGIVIEERNLSDSESDAGEGVQEFGNAGDRDSNNVYG
jgi:hypothetical protein